MANWLGPDPNTRTAWRLVAGVFKTATGGVAVFYLDSQGSTLAPIRYYDPNHPATPGGLISGSALAVDYTSEFPLFWFPDGGVTVLYVSVDSGPLAEVHASFPPQVAALQAAQGAANGTATLDSGGQVPLSELGNAIVEAVNTVAASGTAQTIPDVTTARVSDITLTGNCTLTFPGSSVGKAFTLVLRQDGTGGRTVAWPSGVKWASGVPFVPTPAASSVDVLTFLSVTSGVWFGFPAGPDLR